MSTLGYRPDFIGLDFKVPIPSFSPEQEKCFAREIDGSGFLLNYGNYSSIVDKFRRFPVLTASNIDGSQFQKITRAELFGGHGDKWKKDERIPKDQQWGQELYRSPKSDFDRGHMTKREDVQWGHDKTSAVEAAISTFYFTNAAPQHARVNQSIWRSIEDYILKKETILNSLKICMFTGPVLRDEDPEFVTLVKNEKIKLPVFFWKVIYYLGEDLQLKRVAFMVGQKYLLEKHGIVMRKYIPKTKRDRFMNFKAADTYQVNIAILEEILNWNFPPAKESFQDKRPSKLVFESIEVKRGKSEVVVEDILQGLVL